MESETLLFGTAARLDVISLIRQVHYDLLIRLEALRMIGHIQDFLELRY